MIKLGKNRAIAPIYLAPVKFCVFLLSISVFILLPMTVEAANLTFVSDTISTSVPGASANHVVKFIVTNTIPASGKIIITPQAGAFTIPVGLDYTDIDFLDDSADKILSTSTGIGSGSAIGIYIITGTSSSITFTLNNTDALAAGSISTIKIGSNATLGEIGDQQIQNPVIAGSYKINIKTYDNLDVLIDQADAMLAILSPVQIGATPEALPEAVLVPVLVGVGEGGGEAAGAAAPALPQVPAPALAPKPAPIPLLPKPIPIILLPKPVPIPPPALTPEQIIEAQTVITKFVATTEITASPETISAVTEAIAQMIALGIDINTISAETITVVIEAVEAIAALGIDVAQINTKTLSSIIEAVNTAATIGSDVTTISPIAIAAIIQAIDAAVNVGLDVMTIDAQALSSVIEAVDAAATIGIDVAAINAQTLLSIIRAVNAASYSGVNVIGIDTQAIISVIQAVNDASNSGVSVEAIGVQTLSSVIQAVNQSVDRGIDITQIGSDVIINVIQAIDAAAITGVDVSKISPQVFSFMVQGFNAAEIIGIDLSATGNAALGTIIEALNSASKSGVNIAGINFISSASIIQQIPDAKAAGTNAEESGINIADISFISFASIVKQISEAKSAGADIDTLRSIALNAVTQAAEARVSGAEAIEAARQISSRVLKIANLLGTEALEAIRGFITGTAGMATIIDNIENSGRYTWNTRGNLVIGGATIKGLITEGSDYRIIIFSSLDPSIYDSSDASFSFVSSLTASLEMATSEVLGNLFSSRLFSFFSGSLIAQAQENTALSLKITYPNAGEKLIIGKKYNIKWESRNLSPSALVNIRVAKGLKLNEIAKVINKEFQKTVNILRGDPAVRKTTDDLMMPTSVTVTAVSAGALTATASTGSATFAINISELFQLLGLARFYLLGLIRFRRKKPWGRVIDKFSGKPIQGAAVQVYETEFKKLKDFQITDAEGRFVTIIGAGKYYLNISARGFESQEVKIIEIESPDQIVNLEIPLSPTEKELSLKALKKINILNIIKKILNAIIPYLLVIGTFISIIAATIMPTVLNYGLLYLYIFLDVLKIYFTFHLLRPFGTAKEKNTGMPISLAVVRIFDAKKNCLLATKATNDQGRFNFLLTQGNYYLTCAKSGFIPYRSPEISLKKAGTVSIDIELENQTSI